MYGQGQEDARALMQNVAFRETAGAASGNIAGAQQRKPSIQSAMDMVFSKLEQADIAQSQLLERLQTVSRASGPKNDGADTPKIASSNCDHADKLLAVAQRLTDMIQRARDQSERLEI